MKMTRFEKRYAQVMKDEEEIHGRYMVKFLFSAINFIVTTGKLTEFQNWQVKEAEAEMERKRRVNVKD